MIQNLIKAYHVCLHLAELQWNRCMLREKDVLNWTWFETQAYNFVQKAFLTSIEEDIDFADCSVMGNWESIKSVVPQYILDKHPSLEREDYKLLVDSVTPRLTYCELAEVAECNTEIVKALREHCAMEDIDVFIKATDIDVELGMISDWLVDLSEAEPEWYKEFMSHAKTLL